MHRQHLPLPLALAAALLLAACSGSSDSTPTTTAPPAPADIDVVAGEPFPADRCDENRAAGKITFLTGFDYAAASSIVEVIVAETNGYYDDLCLDVELAASFSTANYPLVAGGQAQFASGGSFSETVAFALANQADLRAVTVAGAEPIDTLILKPEFESLDDIAGHVIGVKGKLPSSIEVMLAGAGLREGDDFETVPVDGFDPVAHMSINGTIGVPGWRSNEPGRLEREGVPFVSFDAASAGVPGSFGVIFTSQDFIDEHPTAAEDFVRATLRGLHDVVADPAGAAAAAIALVDEHGNPNFLSAETETFRAATEAEIIAGSTPADLAPGVPQVDLLQAELDAYSEVDLFSGRQPPSAASMVADLAARVTDGNQVVWPAG